ncbi:MAG: FAD-dependent oxidoreductase [Granulosicoccus sp.]
MKRITVIGAGFGAITAVRQLRASKQNLEITLVAPKPEFIYLPGTIWIPSGIRQSADLRLPLERFFKRNNITYHQGAATGLKDAGRVLLTDAGDVENDGLIIASGGRFLKKLPGIEHAITPCEGIPAAERIRDRLAALQSGTIAIGFAGNPKEPSAMRGGPMFEFLFGIDEQLRTEQRRDKFDIIFFSPAPKPGIRLGTRAVQGLLEEMERRNIKTHLGHKMRAFTNHSVATEGGEFDADLILFMPGMTGNKWFDNTDLPRSEGGLIKADKYCCVEGLDKVFVVGDSGSFPGPDWLPKQAHMADLQAKAAASNLLMAFAGKPPSETFKAELVCIVDCNKSGIFVSRTNKRSLILPRSRLFHWVKRIFEWWYLRDLRR